MIQRAFLKLLACLPFVIHSRSPAPSSLPSLSITHGRGIHPAIFQPGDVLHLNAICLPHSVTAVWHNTVGDGDLNNSANWEGDVASCFGDVINFDDLGNVQFEEFELKPFTA